MCISVADSHNSYPSPRGNCILMWQVADIYLYEPAATYLSPSIDLYFSFIVMADSYISYFSSAVIG